MEEKKSTAFEWALYGWLCFNVTLGFYLLRLPGMTIYGSGWRVLIPPVMGTIATGLLLWRLLKPTWITLCFASLFYVLQIVEVKLPDALYAFQLGLTVKFRITDDPDFVVRLNLVAIATAWLYGLAAYRRFEEERP